MRFDFKNKDGKPAALPVFRLNEEKRRADTQIHAFSCLKCVKWSAPVLRRFFSRVPCAVALRISGKNKHQAIEADCCKTFGVLKANLLEADYIWKRITT
ncbi:hypothetical protein H6A60_07185 [Sutterella massiliensis]|uniref:Uncharacterized protein n=1 Tax=Sutterella massiliensis TaxID=1816689 RepID=A0ABS2DSD9_9BURK|nr:hypothetical protein [Sutterella massiliensis]MBM6704264.1 hypothetical protein [Sutterella massiliensis]